MAEYRDFGATNDERTCLWCGRKLRARREWLPYPSNMTETAVREAHEEKRRNAKIVGYGDYGDGFFCGLRCGYLFGETMASNGRRLQPLKVASR